MIQLLAGAAENTRLIEYGISFDMAVAIPPVRVDLLRQTSAGTGGTAGGALLWSPDDGTADGSSLGGTFSAEPTAGDILTFMFVPANNGLFVMQYPRGREPVIAPAGRLGLRAVTTTGQTPNYAVYMAWDE